MHTITKTITARTFEELRRDLPDVAQALIDRRRDDYFAYWWIADARQELATWLEEQGAGGMRSDSWEDVRGCGTVFAVTLCGSLPVPQEMRIAMTLAGAEWVADAVSVYVDSRGSHVECASWYGAPEHFGPDEIDDLADLGDLYDEQLESLLVELERDAGRVLVELNNSLDDDYFAELLSLDGYEYDEDGRLV